MHRRQLYLLLHRPEIKQNKKKNSIGKFPDELIQTTQFNWRSSLSMNFAVLSASVLCLWPPFVAYHWCPMQCTPRPSPLCRAMLFQLLLLPLCILFIVFFFISYDYFLSTTSSSWFVVVAAVISFHAITTTPRDVFVALFELHEMWPANKQQQTTAEH